MKRKSMAIFFITACSMAGILISYVLAQHYYFNAHYLETGEQLSIFSDLSSRVCGDSSLFASCTKVEESTWSVFLNLPLAAWGILYFTILLLAGFFFFFIKEEVLYLYSLFLLALLGSGALISAFLFVISIAVINALCPLCCAVYTAAVSAFIIFLFYFRKNARGSGQSFQKLMNTMSSNTGYAAMFVLIMALSLLPAIGTDQYLRSVIGEYRQQQGDEKLTQLAMSVCSQQPVYLNLKPYCVAGDINAPVIIAEFSDFMCPFCSQVAIILDELLAEYPSEVALAFVNYPLDVSCNTYIRKNVHPGACILAKGSLAAAAQGKFSAYMRIVFSKAPGLISAEELARLAAAAGIDPAVFLSDIGSPLVDEHLQEQIGSASSNGVRSTPTLFINGKILNHRPSKKLLKKIIECELKRLGR